MFIHTKCEEVTQLPMDYNVPPDTWRHQMRLKKQGYEPVPFNLFVMVEPLIYICNFHGTPVNKNLKNSNLLSKKIKYFVIRNFSK